VEVKRNTKNVAAKDWIKSPFNNLKTELKKLPSSQRRK